MDIHDYTNRIRIKTTRRRKRLEKESHDKKLIHLHKELTAIRKEMDVGWKELNPPVQRGYVRFFVLHPDVRRSKQALFYQNILDKINTRQHSARKDFKVKRRRGGRKIFVDTMQSLHDVEVSEFFSKKFTDNERLQFHEVTIHPAWSKTPVRVFRYNEPWRFVLRVQPDMITKVRVKDLDLERRHAEITRYLDFGERRYRLAKLLHGENVWRWGIAVKPPPENPVKNRSLPDILSEYWPDTEMTVQKRLSTHDNLFLFMDRKVAVYENPYRSAGKSETPTQSLLSTLSDLPQDPIKCKRVMNSLQRMFERKFHLLKRFFHPRLFLIQYFAKK